MTTALVTAGLILSALAQAPDTSLGAIAGWLPGTYDTFAQAAADDSLGAAYRHVRAVLAVAPLTLQGIPSGSRAFYLEQALAGHESEPYRQRVIVLMRRDGAVVNELYRLRNPREVTGFDGRRSLRLLDLEREPGCDAYWERESAEAFRGTAGASGRCASALQGATHAVSSFRLTAGTFTTLDQGLDDTGAVRWGPPPGEQGYVFVKRGEIR